MPKYNYTGTLLDGREVKGVLSANNIFDLETQLVNRGVIPEETTPVYSIPQQLIIKHFKGSEITRTTRQMAILLKSRVPLIEALGLVSDQIKDRLLKSIFQDIIKQVESGKTLTTSISQYQIIFDELYMSMVEAGETSGNLEFSFGKIADYREKSESLAKKVKSAMAYPFLVISVAVVAVVALVLYVVPVFSSMYENFGAELPTLTKNVVETSEFLRQTFWYWLLALFFFLIAVMFLSATKRVKRIIHRVVLTIPYFGRLITNIATARFSRTLGALLTARVDIIYGLEVSAKATGNYYAKELVDKSSHSLTEGKSLTNVLEESHFFPRTLLRMTASGEKTGQLGDMLTYAADFYENETNSEISTLTTLIEPIVIIILGAFIAFILVAMYLPLFELVGTI